MTQFHNYSQVKLCRRTVNQKCDCLSQNLEVIQELSTSAAINAHEKKKLCQFNSQHCLF